MMTASLISRRFTQSISLGLCFALILTMLAVGQVSLTRTAKAQSRGRDKSDQSNGTARRVKPNPPEQGAPAFTLPNLDEVKRRRQNKAEAPNPVPSTVRSKRKPRESRNGKRVGDSGTTSGPRVSSGNTIKPVIDKGGAKILHHGRNRGIVVPNPTTDDAFVTNFLYYGLVSYQSSDVTHWTDIIRSAQPQGSDTMLLAMREFGNTIFESAAYYARGRSNHDYVYDLYETYLMSGPGWLGFLD
jgi:hypothetical protein